MRLAVNGSFLSSKRTKHIKARYYFIKDKIKEGEVDVRYCPTTEMWSNVLNKSKHGTPFKKNQAMLMNVPIEYNYLVKVKMTHPDILPVAEKTGLEVIGINKSHTFNMSVLLDISYTSQNPECMIGRQYRLVH